MMKYIIKREGIAMAKLPLKVGDNCSYTRTISESDVYLFGGVTGDMSPMHFNQTFCEEKSAYGTRVAHGPLVFCLASTASTNIQQKYNSPIAAASYGYDHVRFTAPVFFGDTVTAYYEIVEVDEEANKSFADITITNQDGKVVCVCKHILKYFPPEE